jgi:hypothetical protein
MRSIFVIAGFVVLVPCSCVLAQGETPVDMPTLTVLATHPEADATLQSGEAFYIQYRIESSVPVGVRPEGYYHGSALPLANSGERNLPAGGGTDAAFVFMFPKQPVQMDELRMVVTEVGKRRPIASVAVPVALVWDPAPMASARTTPEWVREWTARRNQAVRSEVDAQMRRTDAAATPFTSMLMAGLGWFVLALAVGGLIVPIIAFLKWEGVWRWLALLPAPVLGFVILRIVIDGSVDATSHNLWPFEILLWGIPAVVYLGLLWLLRLPKRVAHAARQTPRSATR